MSIVFLLLTSAAAGDEDLWLEVDAAAFDIVAYAVAVLLRREPGCHPFTSIDAQSVSLNAWRVFVFALTPAIRYLKAFLEELVGLRLARARAYLSRNAIVAGAGIEDLNFHSHAARSGLYVSHYALGKRRIGVDEYSKTPDTRYQLPQEFQPL